MLSQRARVAESRVKNRLSNGPLRAQSNVYYKAEGFPVEAVYEYIMTVLNSNFEDWRRANPDAPATDFKFSPKKLNPAGSLFDYAKPRPLAS